MFIVEVGAWSAFMSQHCGISAIFVVLTLFWHPQYMQSNRNSYGIFVLHLKPCIVVDFFFLLESCLPAFKWGAPVQRKAKTLTGFIFWWYFEGIHYRFESNACLWCHYHCYELHEHRYSYSYPFVHMGDSYSSLFVNFLKSKLLQLLRIFSISPFAQTQSKSLYSHWILS